VLLRACHLSVGEQLLVFTTDSFMGSPPQIHLVDLDLKVRRLRSNNMVFVTFTSKSNRYHQ
jgi:hypothetical protein